MPVDGTVVIRPFLQGSGAASGTDGDAAVSDETWKRHNDVVDKGPEEALDAALRSAQGRLQEELDQRRAKMHMAEDACRDEWRARELNWSRFETRLEAASKEAAGSSGTLASALRMLGLGIVDAWRGMRDRFRD